MSEKQQSAHNAADTETAALIEQSKKNRTKIILFMILLFLVFQTTVIAAFTLTIMKARTPKFRIHGAAVADFSAGTETNPWLRAALTPEFAVKNANFGRYKYRDTTVEFFYRGRRVGRASVASSKTGWRSTKRVVSDSAVELSLGSSPELAADLRDGVVPITTAARMGGRVEVIFIMKKNRSANMNCTMEIVTASPQTITNISCT